METPVRAKASVEIETMSRGTPKVTVRVDDEDPEQAKWLAVSLYKETLAALAESDQEAEEA